ncbi:rhodanese-like domain-containing protein [Cellulosimicrobium arenosum]|uniref:Rhodanese-like domain-containing protein n=1 Tax=Cellulosimicrobium arenosum TaxID=2708133 RepID=A0A927G623_9MICO|nr:rhodanese-like domain-containing protein [Cellulosimicrobium arenosum]MBD8077612.1 rhodanese-like domain-containing protein [Cellulosimicrobium arenosum]
MIDRLRRLFTRATDDRGVRPTVDAATGVQLVRDGATLLDVRERDEWRAGHAPQAVHVPLADVPTVGPQRLEDGATVVVVCASGMRSRTAARQLRALGYAATSLSGGLGAWQAAGGSVRP